jgi:lysozyme family protein
MDRGVSRGEIAARYSRRYAQAVARLLGVEGGFVDDPTDKGGTTKFGISLRFLKAEGKIDANHDGLADFDLDMDGDIDGVDVRNLTMSGAVSLYYRCFWQREDCDSYPVPIGEMLFDQAVNGGLLAAKKLLQRALNSCVVHIPGMARLTVDGDVGRRSRAALQAVISHPGFGVAAVAEAYRAAAAARYRAIVVEDPRQRRFLKGWLARAAQLGRDM